MRILFLLPDFPYPPTTGGRLKIFNELLFLSERHQCDILCFGTPTEKQKSTLLKALPKINILQTVPQISGIFKQLLTLVRLLCGVPPSFGTFSSARFKAALKKHLTQGNYDVIHYDIVNMAQYLPLASHLPSVHSPNDATSLVYFRVAKKMPWSISKIFMLISAVNLRRFERRNYQHFSKVHVVSNTDAEYLKNLNSLINVDVIPITLNDVELVKLTPLESAANRKTQDFKIICTGNLGNPAIAEGVENFIKHAMPLIVSKVPSSQFLMLGQNIKSNLYEQILGHKNIKFYSWVDNYRSFLAEGDVVLMPDCSGPPGAKTRAVQAMSLGLPVVGTASAFDGIPFTNGKHGLIYSSMDECAELMLMLFKDKAKRDRLGDNAHTLIKNTFSLHILGPRYERLYLDAILEHKRLMYNRANA